MSDSLSTTSSTKSAFRIGGFAQLLTILFLLLKVTGLIDWSWWWVFAPLWIPVGIVLTILLVVGASLLIVGVLAVVFDR